MISDNVLAEIVKKNHDSGIDVLDIVFNDESVSDRLPGLLVKYLASDPLDPEQAQSYAIDIAECCCQPLSAFFFAQLQTELQLRKELAGEALSELEDEARKFAG